MSKEKKLNNENSASNKLRLGLPKGSLQEATIRMMKRAGWSVNVSERSYFPSVDDDELEIVLLRAQEIPRYVHDGVLDCGITGYDWACEYEEDLHDLVELPYSRATARPTRWVPVVPEDLPTQQPVDLPGKPIATDGVVITDGYPTL